MSDTGKVLQGVKINPDKCTRCYECVRYCPTGALHLEGSIWVYNDSICSKCEQCIECSNEAISIVGLPL